jgi:hypothetical protein
VNRHAAILCVQRERNSDQQADRSKNAHKVSNRIPMTLCLNCLPVARACVLA